MITETVYLARRDLKKWWKSKFSVLSTLLRPLAWLVLFGQAFNPLKFVGTTSAQSSLEANFGGAPNYFSFMAAGMLSIMVLQLSLRGMGSLVMDQYLGFFDKVMAAPVRRETMLLSKILSGVVRGVIQALILLVIALPLGMVLDPSFGILQFLGIVVVLAVLSFALSGFFVSIGALAKRWETQEALASAIAFPVMFTSNVLYPVKTMPFWLQPIALINPITYSTEIIRYLLFHTTFDLGALYFDSGVLALLTVGSALIVYVTSRVMSSRK